MSHSKELWFLKDCAQVVHSGFGCERYWMDCTKDTFWASLKIYAPLYTVTTLLSRLNAKDVFTRAVPAMIRSSAFLGIYCGLYAKLTCVFTALLKGHWRIIYWLGPFIASLLCIFIEKKGRRNELAVYVTNQAAESIFKMVLSRGHGKWIPFKNAKKLLFALAWSALLYFYKHERGSLASSVATLIKVMIGTDDKADWVESQVQRVTRPLLHKSSRSSAPNSPSLRRLQPGSDEVTEVLREIRQSNYDSSENQGGLGSPNPSPSPVVLKNAYWINGFLRGFALGYFVKSSLAFLPKLFSLPSLIKNWRAALSSSFGRPSLKFGLFVALMVGIPRFVRVVLRKLLGRDYPVIEAIAGFLGGAASIVQCSTEVTMYLLFKAIEGLFWSLVRRGILKPIPYGAELLYSLSTATLFYACEWEPWTLRPSYKNFLQRTSGGQYGKISNGVGFTNLREECGMNVLKKDFRRFKTPT